MIEKQGSTNSSDDKKYCFVVNQGHPKENPSVVNNRQSFGGKIFATMIDDLLPDLARAEVLTVC